MKTVSGESEGKKGTNEYFNVLVSSAVSFKFCCIFQVHRMQTG